MFDQQESQIIPEGSPRQRLDQAIAQCFSGVSRGQAKKWIALGAVFLDGKRIKVQSRQVSPGQKIALTRLEPQQLARLQKSAAEIEVVYEDDDCFVVNKPSGVFSAPTPETDQNDVLYYFKERSPDLVHRLDRPTSGLLLLAKTKEAAAYFGEALQSRALSRTYLAIGCGQRPAKMKDAPFRVDFPIKGKEAISHFKIIESLPRDMPIHQFSVRLSTGRTHQIRVHSEFIGCSIAGDSKYGRQQSRAILASLGEPVMRPPHLCLHAAEMKWTSRSGDEIQVECPWPHAIERFWEALKQQAAMERS